MISCIRCGKLEGGHVLERNRHAVEACVFFAEIVKVITFFYGKNVRNLKIIKGERHKSKIKVMETHYESESIDTELSSTIKKAEKQSPNTKLHCDGELYNKIRIVNKV